MAERAQIIVKGTVQGVGFRPFVCNLAESLDLKGYVTNTTEGVLIDVEGGQIPEFVRRIRSEAPPLSHITDLSVSGLPPLGFSGFLIRTSIDAAARRPFTLVSPDVSICTDCLRELFDPADRRFLYPFINCTNCGPRFSITRSVPYDRPNTTMAAFTMCPNCQKEYENPRDRRFHAQPNACPQCGPAVELRMRGADRGVRGETAIGQTIKLLKQGNIIAVKGLGGFHIACDALNDAAVRRLRNRKRKSNKPFAVMVPDIAAAERFCDISVAEKDLLLSNKRPVVLLEKKKTTFLSAAVSPNNRFLGAMLPYTPLHYLLFYHPLSPVDKVNDPHFQALVMTSGNLAEEPIVSDNNEAVKKLSHLVDAFLLHDRDIFMRVDDSVARINAIDCFPTSSSPRTSRDCVREPGSGSPQPALSFVRRSRGYAPEPIELGDEGPEVLAVGADLKNTFTIAKGRFLIPAQHIGDMENYETVKFFDESLQNIRTVYRADPKVIVHDLHPGYLSSRWARDHGTRNGEPGTTICAVQHHYAHIGSVMAEHGLTGNVIGVAFDGTGYGTDGNLWGGEFLIADINSFERVGQFRYVPLPGGESAIREPWRTAVSVVHQAEGERAGGRLDEIGFCERFGDRTIRDVLAVSRIPALSPSASGAGRLFDAVAALLGLCDMNSFEGEAAMALEALAISGIDEEYPVEFERENGCIVVDFGPAIRDLLADLRRSVPRDRISTRFHNTVASVVHSMVLVLGNSRGIRDVALSGGTFQNLYLLQRISRTLSSRGMSVYVNRKVPCNDGGISVGQAYLVRERLKKRGVPGFGSEHRS